MAGAVAGGALEDGLAHGLPKDELYLYEDALRKGHSVVFAFAGRVSSLTCHAPPADCVATIP